MKQLSTPYRCNPADAKCNYRNGDSCFFFSLHQKNLYLRHFSPDANALLSMRMICRTLALPGDWHRRIHPDFLNITYIHSGETYVRIGDESFLTEPGDIVLMPPGGDYEFGSSKGSVRSGIVVQGDIVKPILQHFGRQVVFHPQDTQRAEELVERFFQPENTDEHQLALWTYELLSFLEKDEPNNDMPTQLKSAIDLMEKHLDEQISLQDLSRKVGMSPRTLTRLFQKHLQTSPYHYLKDMRMEKARQMLALEEFSIKEIAISTGYQNALNFSTEFRKYYKSSPSAYRLQQLTINN